MFVVKLFRTFHNIAVHVEQKGEVTKRKISLLMCTDRHVTLGATRD